MLQFLKKMLSEKAVPIRDGVGVHALAEQADRGVFFATGIVRRSCHFRGPLTAAI